MSNQKRNAKPAAIRSQNESPHTSITSGTGSNASAIAFGSRSASIRTAGLVSPQIRSSEYTDEHEEDDTDDTSKSKPSHVWCANHAVTPTSMGDHTTVNLVVTAEVFPKVKFVDRDTDLAYTEDEKSICQFVITRCNLHTDIIMPEWWKQVQKYIAQTINRLRNDRNTAMKWAVLGK
jgi:hypothetical protein